MSKTHTASGATEPPQYRRDGPTVSAVVGAYNAERLIGATIDSILRQTRPPDEVIVVDDGSTDGTVERLASYGDAIRVVHRANGGCAAAFNRAFAEARCDYVAMCGADDLCEPQKLEWQLHAVADDPEIDLVFGGAVNFGAEHGSWPPPPGRGVLDSSVLLARLYRNNTICASSMLIRRSLWQRLGPFVERFDASDDEFWAGRLGARDVQTNKRFACDDYDYWLRALGSGAVFSYDPRVLVRYRRHERNATADLLWVHRSACHTHHWHRHLIDDASLRRDVSAGDRFHLGWLMFHLGHRTQARTAFLDSLKLRLKARTAMWALLAALPERPSQRVLAGIRSRTRPADARSIVT
jgi:glycosyltransferase involved in cell wall biosynthesis